MSIDTVRRDLHKLAEEGVLQRTHGGALPLGSHTNYATREKISNSIKAKLAAATVNLIEDGQTIFLDGGTTNVHIAQQLPHDLQATIITNNPPAAVALMNHANIEVILSGGRLLKHCMTTTGPTTLNLFNTIRADICILGICSLHAQEGIGASDYEEMQIKRVMIDRSAEVIGTATADKLGMVYNYTVDDIRSLTYLVTESNVAEHSLQSFRDKGVQVTQVNSQTELVNRD